MRSRQQEILRELNLYPLWRLRTDPVPAHSSLSRGAADTQQADVATPSFASLDELKAAVKNCTLCNLRAGCSQTVCGVGDEKADWLFVGEAPGENEDAQGEPFVGQAGKLLDNMLAAMKLKRSVNVYITNVVKCRPPDNRIPHADEIAQCLPYLARQIQLIQPKLIVALGKTAATTLLRCDDTVTNLRGKVHHYQGIPLVVTYHPAYLLHAQQEKAQAWQDLCLALTTIKK